MIVVKEGTFVWTKPVWNPPPAKPEKKEEPAKPAMEQIAPLVPVKVPKGFVRR